jgi:hypothetical protein
MRNKQIAESLIVSTGTVKWYTSQIYGKLAVRSRTQAVSTCCLAFQPDLHQTQPQNLTFGRSLPPAMAVE